MHLFSFEHTLLWLMEADDWLLRAAAQRRRRLSVDVVFHLKNGCFLIIVKKKVDVSHMTDRLTMIKGIVIAPVSVFLCTHF